MIEMVLRCLFFVSLCLVALIVIVVYVLCLGYIFYPEALSNVLPESWEERKARKAREEELKRRRQERLKQIEKYLELSKSGNFRKKDLDEYMVVILRDGSRGAVVDKETILFRNGEISLDRYNANLEYKDAETNKWNAIDKVCAFRLTEAYDVGNDDIMFTVWERNKEGQK